MMTLVDIEQLYRSYCAVRHSDLAR